MTYSSIPLLELRNFSLMRDDRCLMENLSLVVNAGDVIQVIGPNGAGKTSLLRVISGISRDFLGDFLFHGTPIGENRWEFASDSLYLAHLPGIKKSLTPRENLQWYQSQVGSTSSISEALAKVGLAGYEDVLAGQLSAGQLRRIALARLHVSKAKLWILDEPFTAIDKKGVKELEELIMAHSQAGGAVLITSHQDLSLPHIRHIDLNDFRAKTNWLNPEEAGYE